MSLHGSRSAASTSTATLFIINPGSRQTEAHFSSAPQFRSCRQRAAENRGFLSNVQIGMRFNFEKVDAPPQRFDLKIRQGDRIFARSDNGMDSRDRQDLRPCTSLDANEQVTWKQRLFDRLRYSRSSSAGGFWLLAESVRSREFPYGAILASLYKRGYTPRTSHSDAPIKCPPDRELQICTRLRHCHLDVAHYLFLERYHRAGCPTRISYGA